LQDKILKIIKRCNNCEFLGGDYEEYRLLVHKDPVRNSKETHYFSTTEPSQLMLCKKYKYKGFVFLRSVRRLLVTAGVVPRSPILVTLMMEAIRSSETSVLTRSTRRNTPENVILHSHRRENLKSYIFPSSLADLLHIQCFPGGR
jgi:hypothetical protein